MGAYSPAGASKGYVCIYWRMIRGGEFLNFSAILTVNNHFFGEVHDASRAKDEIDAQAVLTMEGATAIIPPRKIPGRRGICVGTSPSSRCP